MRDRKDLRPVLFFYAGKDEESLTYRDEIDALKCDLDLEVVYVLEEPPEGGGYEEGFITPEVLAKYLPEDRLRRQTFVCGPPAMMDAVQDALRAVGIPREKIQMEQFDLV
jgi:NAD(P)H-flavin reductase